MTRKEEMERKAKIRADQYSHPVEWNDCYHHWIEGAEWADKTMIVEIEKRMGDLYPQLPDASKVLNEDISIEEANALGKYVALESLLSFIVKS